MKGATLDDKMGYVLSSLKLAKKYGLEIEVITFALIAANRYHLDVIEAMDYAMGEWIK